MDFRFALEGSSGETKDLTTERGNLEHLGKGSVQSKHKPSLINSLYDSETWSTQILRTVSDL
jgi:hypothetical protein